MKVELHYYDIFPKVFLVNEEANITIRPLGEHASFSEKVRVSVISMIQGMPSIYPDRNNLCVYDITPDEDGCIRFSHVFTEESEYRILLDQEQKGTIYLAVYALEADMKGRYPFRGDLHMHTRRSDGRESPAVVAANYRRYGYDFTVISDHHRYYPSLEAIDAYKDVPVEMNIVIGEEIHLPGNDLHIVNFGGKYSVNGLLKGRAQDQESDRRSVIDNPPPVITQEEYEAQVNALIEELNIPDGIEKFTYASSVWAFRHIKAGEGLGIFPHPFWILACTAYHVPENLRAYMMQTQPFDAYEVLGGELYYQQNGFQAVQYYEDRAHGLDYPIVGSTDSHSSLAEHNPGCLIASTFVFAEKNESTSLIEAIKQKYSVAVDTISKEYRLVGETRLVKYARFLLDEFTPLHDELCYEEGRLMKAYVTGDKDAAEGLAFIHGRMEKLFEKYFAV